jgi:hypothetical protein
VFEKNLSSCPHYKEILAKCPCPEDCPRKGFCCECIEFHASLGELPYCIMETIWEHGARTSAGGGVDLEETAPKRKTPGMVTLDTPDFKLTEYASCPG